MTYAITCTTRKPSNSDQKVWLVEESNSHRDIPMKKSLIALSFEEDAPVFEFPEGLTHRFDEEWLAKQKPVARIELNGKRIALRGQDFEDAAPAAPKPKREKAPEPIPAKLQDPEPAFEQRTTEVVKQAARDAIKMVAERKGKDYKLASTVEFWDAKSQLLMVRVYSSGTKIKAQAFDGSGKKKGDANFTRVDTAENNHELHNRIITLIELVKSDNIK